MPLVSILYTIQEKPVKEKVERELNWYDTVKGEMLHFKGGKLNFRYKEDDYLVKMGVEERNRRGITTTFRMLPEVEDVEVVNYNNVVKEDNKKKVDEWFNSYVNYEDSDVTVASRDGVSVSFDVPEEELDDFLYQAERNGFLHSL